MDDHEYVGAGAENDKVYAEAGPEEGHENED